MPWEYNVESRHVSEAAISLQVWLEEMGGVGWELVTILRDQHGTNLFFFKRPEPADRALYRQLARGPTLPAPGSDEIPD
jgi:hypothetical protein